MILLAFAVAMGQAMANDQRLVTGERGGHVVILPAGTPVHLVTVDSLDSRTVKQGQRFALRVVEDVSVGSVTIIPSGTKAVGEVEAVSSKGMVGQAGKLVLQPLFIDLADERVNLVGEVQEQGKDSTAAVAVGTLLISGLGLFVTGKSAAIPAGSPLPGRVRSEVSLAIPVTSQAPSQ